MISIIQMWGAIASGLGGLLRKVAPVAINWGVNKLMSTGIGRNYVAPVASMINQYSPQ